MLLSPLFLFFSAHKAGYDLKHQYHRHERKQRNDISDPAGGAEHGNPIEHIGKGIDTVDGKVSDGQCYKNDGDQIRDIGPDDIRKKVDGAAKRGKKHIEQYSAVKVIRARGSDRVSDRCYKAKSRIGQIDIGSGPFI